VNENSNPIQECTLGKPTAIINRRQDSRKKGKGKIHHVRTKGRWANLSLIIHQGEASLNKKALSRRHKSPHPPPGYRGGKWVGLEETVDGKL